MRSNRQKILRKIVSGRRARRGHTGAIRLILTYVNISTCDTLRFMASAKQVSRRGRPPNLDPPRLFSTNLPESVYGLLSRLAEAQHRTKSEVLSDALRAYARRFREVI